MNAGRELDALVAEKVMGIAVLDTAAVRSGWGDIHLFRPDQVDRKDYDDHGKPRFTLEPVYVDMCFCSDAEALAKHADECIPQGGDTHRADIARWGHSHWCLAPVPAYSTDITAAWEVVERLASVGYVVKVQAFPSGLDPTAQRYQATICKNLAETGTAGPTDPHAESPAHAICLMALKVAGAEVPA